MKAERTGEYFHSLESDYIPQVKWEEVLQRQILISPTALTLILNDARQFLSTEEGPNLHRRKIFAEEWFGWWSRHLKNAEQYEGKDLGFKLCPFGEVRERIEWLRDERQTGLLNVAGAEGHAGHIHAAFEMSQRVNAVWAFEQNSYFVFKERPAPFLSVEVRLWMWCYTPLGLITVNPEQAPSVDINEHYQNLFYQTGIDRSFAEERDPNCQIKIKRGLPGPYGYKDNILSHFKTMATRERVQRLFDGVDHEDGELEFDYLRNHLDYALMGISENFYMRSYADYIEGTNTFVTV